MGHTNAEELSRERERALDVVRTCARSLAKQRIQSGPPPDADYYVLVEVTPTRYTTELILPTRPRELLEDAQFIIGVALDGVTIIDWTILYDGGGMAVSGHGDLRVVLDDD